MKLSDKYLARKREYLKKWRQANKDKVRLYKQRHLEKKAREEELKGEGMNHKQKDKNGCIFRPFGVQCYEQDAAHCRKCGWNPDVEAERIAKIMERQDEKRVRGRT